MLLYHLDPQPSGSIEEDTIWNESIYLGSRGNFHGSAPTAEKGGRKGDLGASRHIRIKIQNPVGDIPPGQGGDFIKQLAQVSRRGGKDRYEPLQITRILIKKQTNDEMDRNGKR